MTVYSGSLAGCYYSHYAVICTQRKGNQAKTNKNGGN
nr:MAG TPA: hypothetical protein [Caudoviricetes sp.]